MKRDSRLQRLSADHHHALVLARRVAEWAQTPTLDVTAVKTTDETAAQLNLAYAAARLASQFAETLVPHFEIEESLLLPPLAATGKREAELVERTLADHCFLAEQVKAGLAHPAAATLMAFSERLVAHIRMEERELFPACEAKLSSEILDEVERASARTPAGKD